jgi:hypothetical protein
MKSRNRPHFSAHLTMMNPDELNRQTCDRIRRNDPSLDHVNTYSMANGGYGRPLGDALLQNATVIRIDIDIENFFGGDDDAENSKPLAMLQYVRTSSVLHTVSLGRRLSWSTFIYNPRVLSLVGDIVVAMSQSHHLTTFISNISLPADDFYHFLTTTTTVRDMELNRSCLKGFCSLADESIHRLLDSFEINQSLSSLSMEFCRSTDELVERFIERLDQRAATSSFVSVTVKSNFDVRKSVPQSTRVLETLSICDHEFGAEKTTSNLWEALSANQSITRMTIGVLCLSDAETEKFVTFFQTQANRNGNQLRDLCLNTFNSNVFGSMDYTAVVTSLLFGSALDTLEMCHSGNLNENVFLGIWQLASIGSDFVVC